MTDPQEQNSRVIQGELGSAMLALADYRPTAKDMTQIATYLAEITASIGLLPPLKAGDPLDHGFDPAWPEQAQ